jgi:hypothetical protein
LDEKRAWGSEQLFVEEAGDDDQSEGARQMVSDVPVGTA